MNWKEISEDITDIAIGVFSEEIEISFFDKTSSKYLDPVKVQAVYSSNYKQINVDGNLVSSNLPMVEISLRSLAQIPKKKDKVTARGVSYSAKEVEENAEGDIKIYLSR